MNAKDMNEHVKRAARDAAIRATYRKPISEHQREVYRMRLGRQRLILQSAREARDDANAIIEDQLRVIWHIRQALGE